jgi:hypothetical protein
VSFVWRFEKGAFLSTPPDEAETDLDRLAQRLPNDEGDAFSRIELPVLTRWAIEGRCPNDLDEATHVDGHKAIAIAREVLGIVRTRMTGHP